MKSFLKFDFDPHACQNELGEFKNLLDSKPALSEANDILPFFSSHKHLSAFLGSYFTYIEKFDRLAFEYQLFGDFSCDLVVGDSDKGRYCFIEFENASHNSVFEKKRTKETPEWGTRFEHGFSQIVDWFWKLDDMKNTTDFQNRFERNLSQYFGMLVVGRDTHLEHREKDRKQWRLNKVLIDSRYIFCVTFDELYVDLNNRLQRYISIGKSLI